jgi:hypothetical protein
VYTTILLLLHIYICIQTNRTQPRGPPLRPLPADMLPGLDLTEGGRHVMGKDGNLYKANHTVSESLSGSGHLTSPVRLSKDAHQHHQQQQQQQQIVMVPQQHTLGGWMGEGPPGGSPGKQPLQPIEGT